MLLRVGEMENWHGRWSLELGFEAEAVGSAPGYPCSVLFLELHWGNLIQAPQNEKELLSFPGSIPSKLVILDPFPLIQSPASERDLEQEEAEWGPQDTVLTHYLVSHKRS